MASATLNLGKFIFSSSFQQGMRGFSGTQLACTSRMVLRIEISWVTLLSQVHGNARAVADIYDGHRRCIISEQGLVLLQVSLRQVIREEELSASCHIPHKVLGDHAPAHQHNHWSPQERDDDSYPNL